MSAEIFTDSDGMIKGVLKSRYLDAPFVFTDMIHMIYKMEEIFDTNGFPQAFLSPRSFEDGKRGVRKNGSDNGAQADMLLAGTEGCVKCTFELAVRFRQNATWQGQISWVEKDIKQNFRSVLEMLKLINEALAETNESMKPAD